MVRSASRVFWTDFGGGASCDFVPIVEVSASRVVGTCAVSQVVESRSRRRLQAADDGTNQIGRNGANARKSLDRKVPQQTGANSIQNRQAAANPSLLLLLVVLLMQRGTGPPFSQGLVESY